MSKNKNTKAKKKLTRTKTRTKTKTSVRNPTGEQVLIFAHGSVRKQVRFSKHAGKIL